MRVPLAGLPEEDVQRDGAVRTDCYLRLKDNSQYLP